MQEPEHLIALQLLQTLQQLQSQVNQIKSTLVGQQAQIAQQKQFNSLITEKLKNLPNAQARQQRVTRKKSAFALFCKHKWREAANSNQESLQIKHYIKQLGREWRSMDPLAKEHWQQRARQIDDTGDQASQDGTELPDSQELERMYEENGEYDQ